jgi:hypothetical protein
MEIDKIPLDELQSLINSGVSNLPAPVQQYMDVLELIRGMYSKYKSKQYIINQLKLEPYKLNERKAKQLFADTINYFYCDNDIKKEAWCNIYAEKLENAAMVSWEMNDMKTYKELIMEAAELRGCKKEDALEKEPYDDRPIIYIFDNKKMGLPEPNKRELKRMIDNMDITESQKRVIKRDAMITEDVEFEIFPEDEDKAE